jgi:hypothetical protein
MAADKARTSPERITAAIRKSEDLEMEKTEGKKIGEETPIAIVDGVPNLKSISGALRVLVQAASGDFGYRELLAFQDIVHSTLKRSIAEMDEIIKDIEESYGEWNWEPRE